MTKTKEFRDCISLQVWLKQPLTSSKEISVRHDVVEAFAQNPELREKLRDQHLRGMSFHIGILDCRIVSKEFCFILSKNPLCHN